jgi:hypothetical protein
VLSPHRPRESPPASQCMGQRPSMVLIRNLGLLRTGMPGLKLPTFYLSFGVEPQGSAPARLISGPPLFVERQELAMVNFLRTTKANFILEYITIMIHEIGNS